jgi:hypothetical protein
MTVTASILDSTKKVLGLDGGYDAFDQDVIMHINTVFADLNQLGIGPVLGYAIEGSEEEWTSFIGDDANLNAVKSYVYLRVRLLFDPPGTSYLIDAMKEQIAKMEWRLSVLRESVAWVDPHPVDLQDVEILDGGVIT